MNTMEQIQRLKKHTRFLMQHNYVEEVLQLPVFNESKVFITYCLLRELEMDEAIEAEIFASIFMIQSALDRHEEILDQSTMSSNRNRQLVVLSGDYFSSLYYLLLSKCENLQLISYLSSAVQQINEWKSLMHHEQQNRRNSIEYMESVGKIESLLFSKSAESFGLHKYIPFIERYLLLTYFQANGRKNSLNDKQLSYLQQCEIDIKEKRVDIPLLFAREHASTFYSEEENDLMLGEG
jgi:heptaprenyl diphosphate synthase